MITTDVLPATRWRDPRDCPGRARPARDRGAHRRRPAADAGGPAGARAAPDPARRARRPPHRHAARPTGCSAWAPADRRHRRPGPLATAVDRRRVPGGGRGEPALGWPRRRRRTPQLLVTDLPAAPSAGLGGPLCVVVHVAAAVPTDSPYWSDVDGVVLAGRGYGTPAGPAARPPRRRRAGPARPRPARACWTATGRSSSPRSSPKPSSPSSRTDPSPPRWRGSERR